MSIEIIQVITLEEFKETGVAGHFDDDTIKAAINTSYIRLNALCNQNIKKRWNITDTTNPLYLKEEYKEITKQAFFLQTEYNLVNNLNLSSEGSQQESLGSWNHSYNNPKEKPFICDGVQDMLQQATLFVPVKSVSLNVANNKCVDINDICGELPAGDKYDLSFVRWGEANAKFLPKNIGIEFANKILITDKNGYIRTTDIDPMFINYLKKDEASVIYQKMQDERLLTTDKTVVGAINEIKESVITADITPRVFENITMSSGWVDMNFNVELPVDYDFEILGIVNSKAYFLDENGRKFPTNVYGVKKINTNDYNVNVNVMFYSPASESVIGNLKFELKLLIRKVNN